MFKDGYILMWDDSTRFLDTTFEAQYLSASVAAEAVYDNINVTRNCNWALPDMREVVERADWLDPVFHRAEAAFDRGDASTALLAWSMASEMGVEEAQDNLAYVLDQCTLCVLFSHVVGPPRDAAGDRPACVDLLGEKRPARQFICAVQTMHLRGARVGRTASRRGATMPAIAG